MIRTGLAIEGYEFSGPDKAARDILAFLREDEEVNARFQRNKDKVQQAMHNYFGGVLAAGTNLPVELEGYNLLLLERYESTHVRFRDEEDRLFTVETPAYRYRAPDASVRASFVPAILLPELRAAIQDICQNPDHDLDPAGLELSLEGYEGIWHFADLDELAFQVLLVESVITLGASETELARFPGEVRKARYLAERLARARARAAVVDPAHRIG